MRLLYYFVFLNLMGFALHAQSTYTINLSIKNEDCTKGAAGVQVEGVNTNTEFHKITWSTGQNSNSIHELNEGNYTVRVEIRNKVDSTAKHDSTYAVKVTDEGCLVSIPNHFTPNADDFNDNWSISNTTYFPNFELYVYNKWGQLVHSQKGNYTPWDVRWNGIAVPDGTYYYVFYYDGGSKGKHEKGDVTILR